MYIANCLYMGSEVEITAKTELVLDNIIASIICGSDDDFEVLEVLTDKPKCKGYVYTEKGKFEITEVEGDKVYYKDENGVERAFHEG